MDVHRVIENAAATAKNRLDLWSAILNARSVEVCAEIGVFRGEFARHILQNCGTITTYYMIDPWRHLSDWDKPLNLSDAEFEKFKREALRRTEFAASKRIVLEGTTAESAARLPEHGLDFAYLDGDHTLRGISLDLFRLWPKMKSGGILAGDDFCTSIWQHGPEFEPTLVFPMAVHFAEAVGAKIYGFPFDQFAIVAGRSSDGFEFRDLTGRYGATSLREALGSPDGDSLKKKKWFGLPRARRNS